MTNPKTFLVKGKNYSFTEYNNIIIETNESLPKDPIELTKEVEDKIKKKVLDSGLTYPEYIIEEVFKELKKLEDLK